MITNGFQDGASKVDTHIVHLVYDVHAHMAHGPGLVSLHTILRIWRILVDVGEWRAYRAELIARSVEQNKELCGISDRHFSVACGARI
jgi:hypothetical protein